MENITIFDDFHYAVNKYGDPRIKDWYLMSNPIPTVALTMAFLITVTVLLPGFMKNRKPYQFKKLLIVYNGLQVLFSIWLFYGFAVGGWMFPYYNGKCFYPGRGKNMLFTSHMYFLSKFSEFIDTVLFALRKKDSQITRLHLYHHGIMPIGSWICVKYAPDSPVTFLGFVNSFVHIVMYSYYMLSAMGPNIQKYLWWKKYITVMQLTQFVICLIHVILTSIHGCNMPFALSYFSIVQSITFFIMFGDFYLHAYKKKVPTTSKELSDEVANAENKGLTNGLAKENKKFD
ncbi:elongation of very long chain fatty acids protein AAEL008004-like [Diorhabda carinulata]|uniref:elongation of very long chain fatty acids protein AAEL008004-like n=1 Tax=Diorhabda carinulata TaxID=1163345 RepID=UPI0025A0F30E|nr:elongation of very long chain fatty acids protein AAEL008004-like [Diorhabda carinulata]XP_057667161.1 elongation of very long chain fatty acids protein AAEL008004-like [Diorhabda carinulata]XP_057667162.1 elongation of very long chain fatty acids protein AAEL008004-like [Diorhabda carinulata]XP_057667163.1 elongation of very long chain fatty acids protein AAEL008004-like [Diorhabda carinulata]XP_057667164.1 elongation of very long chain fatty acids protein AAEL008004-like [Diorhabda carinul